MSTPEDLRIDALDEIAADAAYAQHEDGRCDESCAFCADAKVEADYEATAAADGWSWPSHVEAAVARRLRQIAAGAPTARDVADAEARRSIADLCLSEDQRRYAWTAAGYTGQPDRALIERAMDGDR